MIDSEGELLWENQYGVGECNAVIELKGGSFMLAGRVFLTGDTQGLVVVINNEGNVIWSRNYGSVIEGDRESFYAMRETEGGVVLTGNERPHIWAVKIDLDGDEIWARSHRSRNASSMAWDMISTQDGFVITGWDNGLDHPYALKEDEDGGQDWWQCYDGQRETHMKKGTGIARMREGGFIIAGFGLRVRGNGNRGMAPFAIRTTSEGVARWQVDYPVYLNDLYGPGQNKFQSVIVTDDQEIVAAGTINNIADSTYQNGMIMKLEPDRLDPIIFGWLPRDTVLTTLIGDTIRFIVRARDQMGNDLDNLWILGEDTISTDTTTVVIWEELGEFELTCQVSNEELTSSVTWRVSVLEWLIDSFTPDTSEFIIQRGTEVDFALNIRSINEIDPGFLWTHIDRNENRNEIGGENSISYRFVFSGDQAMSGEAFYDDEFQSKNWSVHVRSAVWWWWPRALELSVVSDTLLKFEIIPFNAESDSLRFQWFHENELIDQDSSIIELQFNNLGMQELRVIVNDGLEVDTISWNIDVYETPNTLVEPKNLPPREAVLYSPVPNPFNSTLGISFFVPVQQYVELNVFDVSGRKVQKLIAETITKGTRFLTWNANDVPAGEYLVELKTDNNSIVKRALLIK